MRFLFLLCCVLFVALSAPVYAASDVALYNDGNEAYRNGKYEKAFELYDQIKGKNPGAYYNKASAAYKSGFLGKAMVNLYRAERIAPGDKDVVENIMFLKSIKTDREAVEKQGLLAKIFRSLQALYDIKQVTYSFLFLYVVVAILTMRIVLASKTGRRKTAPYLYAMGVSALLVGFMASVQIYQFEQEGGAVAILPEVSAFAAPSEDSALVFTFHEATKVTIEKVEGDYAFVYVSSGLSGWVKRGALERI